EGATSFISEVFFSQNLDVPYCSINIEIRQRTGEIGQRKSIEGVRVADRQLLELPLGVEVPQVA
ncbi:hypothetical protein ABTD85_23530, partial [Acinetobacter baumannii]